MVFSVLGNREVRGRAGVIIEGESGANDPVGIALLLSLLTLGGAMDGAAIGTALVTFFVQMVVGAAVGVGGGWLLLWTMRHVPLPGEGLYPLRTLAVAVGLNGLATVAHGSGFLVALIAGILIGDVSAPFKREIERFHSSLAEIVAFVVLGLTISLRDTFTSGARLIGLVLAVLLAFVVRPLLVGPLLLAVRLSVGERVFVREVHREYEVWISLVVRDGRPLRVRPDSELRAGHELLVLAYPETDPDPAFSAPG